MQPFHRHRYIGQNAQLPLIFALALLASLLLNNATYATEQRALSPQSPPRLTADNPCHRPIKTQQGQITGQLEYKDTIGTCSYKGIPYAQAPVGELRWQAPHPIAPGQSPLTAHSFSPDCIQSKFLRDVQYISQAQSNSEDCLYLNIWRPTKPGKYPVMVWIHGGTLLLGSGALNIYQGTSFAARQEVIIVTLNYRLGPFGYLSHADLVDTNDGLGGGSAGNYGLLDQIEALRWVKNNIQEFSGDENNITVFGQSAGAWSIMSLLTTPLSDTLFHKAIAQSGGSHFTHDSEHAFKTGDKFAKRLKCDIENAAQCLRALPAEVILKGANRFSLRCPLSTDPIKGFCFLPREDGVILDQSPISAIRKGDYHKMPTLLGYNRKDPGLLKSSIVDTIDALDGHPTFIYRFNYQKNYVHKLSSGAHSAELSFPFDTLDRFSMFFDRWQLYNEKQVSDAQPVVDHMQSYWANFAKTGNPNGLGLTHQPLTHWPDLKESADQQVLLISNDIRAARR